MLCFNCSTSIPDLDYDQTSIPAASTAFLSLQLGKDKSTARQPELLGHVCQFATRQQLVRAYNNIASCTVPISAKITAVVRFEGLVGGAGHHNFGLKNDLLDHPVKDSVHETSRGLDMLLMALG